MFGERCFHNLWRKLVFWVGDIRRIKHFPFLTWDVHEHMINYEECFEAMRLAKAGDIGLHRDLGYLSNIAIPGCFKHAFVFIAPNKIVEAVSEGVLLRHCFWPIRSDYSIILRPKNITPDELKNAMRKAGSIVGCQYDADFKFDLEDEIKHFDLDDVRENLSTWDGGFSCTEVAAFTWWHKKDDLRLFRKKVRGKLVIVADDFINNSFEIVWLSKSVTLDVVQNLGLDEEGVSMIEEYWRKQSGVTD